MKILISMGLGFLGLQERLRNSVVFLILMITACDSITPVNSFNQTINGVEEGEWRTYYANGQLKEQRFYKNGMKVGTLKTWWDNGQIQVLYRFKNGEYDGTCVEWNREGVITKKMNYQLGYEEGEQRQWYDDGSVRSNYIIKEGRRFGLLGTKNCINVKDSLNRF